MYNDRPTFREDVERSIFLVLIMGLVLVVFIGALIYIVNPIFTFLHLLFYPVVYLGYLRGRARINYIHSHPEKFKPKPKVVKEPIVVSPENNEKWNVKFK